MIPQVKHTADTVCSLQVIPQVNHTADTVYQVDTITRLRLRLYMQHTNLLMFVGHDK